MSRRKRSQHTAKQKNSSNHCEIAGVILFLAGLFIIISLFADGTGILGQVTQDAVRFLFGCAGIFFALFLLGIGGRYALWGTGIQVTRKSVLTGVLCLLLLALIHHIFVNEGSEMEIRSILSYGGIFGAVLSKFLHEGVGSLGTSAFLLGFIIVDILLLTHWSLSTGARKVGNKAREIGTKTGRHLEDMTANYLSQKAQYDAEQSAARLEILVDKPEEFIYKKAAGENTADAGEDTADIETETAEAAAAVEEQKVSVQLGTEMEAQDAADAESEKTADMKDFAEKETEEKISEIPLPEEDPFSGTLQKELSKEAEGKEENTESVSQDSQEEAFDGEYHFPPLSLLHTEPEDAVSFDGAKKKGEIIEETLRSFGVKAKIVHISVGPTVTRFELRPEVGVRISKIESLSNELAMALAATHIRIEAPIPGKPAVGIEIPNLKAHAVPLRDVLSSPEFRNSKGNITVALGKDITGKPVVTDLSQMPHLLIAGSTGSGKSVCINSIITSIIYHSRPQDVKLMLIDPKVVELSVYNGMPHLRTEVVTDMKKAQGTLNWAVREMEARYQLFAGARVRNIEGYNQMNSEKKLPYILIIVDEFADLMNVAAKEVEVLIQRLTQKARAAGIHLILATQRPSADVITGVIKSNIPSRIAFMVESNLNSRIILDEGGAETLLGKGDMLFKQAGALTTRRIQGAFISDREVESVVNYVKQECLAQDKAVQYEPIDLSVPEKETDREAELEEQDDLLREASEWILDTKRASVSALQRRFRIGYTRAGRLMDMMEKMGLVGPSEGAKPRNILMTKAQLEQYFAQDSKETES